MSSLRDWGAGVAFELPKYHPFGIDFQRITLLKNNNPVIYKDRKDFGIGWTISGFNLIPI
jgi:hypothetical protein